VSASDKAPIQNLPVRQEPQPEARATSSQIGVTAIVVTAIVTIFLWGLNHQRSETGGSQAIASDAAPAPAQGEGQKAAPPADNQPSGKTNPQSTTGSGSSGSPPPQQQQQQQQQKSGQ
jgi:hypothetical protein